jgi:hypothetical protein
VTDGPGDLSVTGGAVQAEGAAAALLHRGVAIEASTS